MHVIPPGKTGRAAAKPFTFSFWEVEFKRRPREIIKIIAVNVPGKNPQFSWFYWFLLSFSTTALTARMVASGPSTALPATTRCRT